MSVSIDIADIIFFAEVIRCPTYKLGCVSDLFMHIRLFNLSMPA